MNDTNERKPYRTPSTAPVKPAILKSFADAMRAHALRHPSLQPQDALKACYQSRFGAEHLLSDMQKAEDYLRAEFDSLPSAPVADEPLVEPLSDTVCRINLRVWKAKNLPIDWLLRMFFAMANVPQTLEAPIRDPNEAHFATITALAKENIFAFSAAEWESSLSTYLEGGVRPVHHSELYRAAEAPAYRLVCSRFVRILPILEAVHAQLQLQERTTRSSDADTHMHPCTHAQTESKTPTADSANYKTECNNTADHSAYIIAIDGRCGAGKTTLADQLSDILSAPVLHMDDFFLPPSMRTPERLAEAGGNLDRERFIAEVLPYLHTKNAFSYGIFDCSQMKIGGNATIPESTVRIVEGSYSHHPAFAHYADLTIFATVDPETQLERIRKRNGMEHAEQFRTRWIPMEETYFTAFATETTADLCV